MLQGTTAMLRIAIAFILFAMVLPVAAIAQEAAPLPARQIDAKTVKSVCRKARGKDSFAEIRARLTKKKTTVFQFFAYGQCKQKAISLGAGPYKTAGAYQVLLFEPEKRRAVAIAVIDYFRDSEKNLTQLQAIVNQPDRYGRTILDLLDLLKTSEFSKDQAAIAALDQVRAHLCVHGAVYTTPQEDCQISDEMKEMMKAVPAE
jgi:hypothetical protein